MKAELRGLEEALSLVTSATPLVRVLSMNFLGGSLALAAVGFLAAVLFIYASKRTGRRLMANIDCKVPKLAGLLEKALQRLT